MWEAQCLLLSGQFRWDRTGRQIRGHFSWLPAFRGSQVRGMIALWTALGGLLVKNFHTPHLASLQLEVKGGRVQEECASKGDLSLSSQIQLLYENFPFLLARLLCFLFIRGGFCSQRIARKVIQTDSFQTGTCKEYKAATLIGLIIRHWLLHFYRTVFSEDVIIHHFTLCGQTK